MSYEKVDPVIREWSARHGFTLFESMQGFPERTLRCVYVSSQAGECFQIWVGEPTLGTVAVHAADVEGHESFQQEWSVPLQGLDAVLEEALVRVHHWMNR